MKTRRSQATRAQEGPVQTEEDNLFDSLLLGSTLVSDPLCPLVLSYFQLVSNSSLFVRSRLLIIHFSPFLARAMFKALRQVLISNRSEIMGSNIIIIISVEDNLMLDWQFPGPKFVSFRSQVPRKITQSWTSIWATAILAKVTLEGHYTDFMVRGLTIKL